MQWMDEVYAASDAWSAGKAVWRMLGRCAGLADAGVEAALPSNMSPEPYASNDIPMLPSSAECCPILESVLRGLLQSTP